MKKQKTSIPQKNIDRLEMQGFTGLSASELSDHQLGIRFAYWLCASLVVMGLIFKSIPILAFAMLAAFGAVVHSRHPFDYIYNYGVRQLLKKPETPRRTIQGKIACGIATVMILGIILSFNYDYMTVGYTIGIMLLSSAFLVASTDYCIPSVLYKIFKSKSGNIA